MAERDDWRLHGQETYLKGATLVRRRYRRYPRNPTWDHDHCEFCWAKFMVEEHPGVLHDGYTTLDEYRWICAGCFAEFAALFEWKVIRAEAHEET